MLAARAASAPPVRKAAAVGGRNCGPPAVIARLSKSRLDAFRATMERCLQQELNAEIAALVQRLETTDERRLESEGYARTNLCCEVGGFVADRRLLRLRKQCSSSGDDDGAAVADNRFGSGDMVALTCSDDEGLVVAGVIHASTGGELQVLVGDEVDVAALPRRGWRADHCTNRVTHERMLAALRALTQNDGTPLRDMLLISAQVTAAANAAPLRRHSDSDGGLNASQRRALDEALMQRLTLIQGPPGTGKTRTSVQILAALRRHYDTPILATAATNVAVDNLLEGLADAGVNVVRIGTATRVRDALRGRCLSELLEAQPDQAGRQRLRRQLDELRPRYNHGGDDDDDDDDDEARRRQRGRVLEALRAADKQLTLSVLRDAEVICATCAGAGADVLHGMTFPVVLIDEATQATFPQTLVPLSHGAERLVLVGDHRQLRPTILSRQPDVRAQLKKTLFERLVDKGVPPLLLDRQYRMHPLIAAFPSAHFYQHRLLDGVAAADRPPPTCPAAFPHGRPVSFLPSPDAAEQLCLNGSYCNAAEADLVAGLLAALLAGAGLSPGQLGVITPYAAQVRLIRQRLAAAVPSCRAVEVKSVDGFQGREKEVIVFSAVRSNDRRTADAIGFLKDGRRLNVALTRARRGLVVVGNAATLGRNEKHWQHWLRWVIAADLVVVDSLPPSERQQFEQWRQQFSKRHSTDDEENRAE